MLTVNLFQRKDAKYSLRHIIICFATTKLIRLEKTLFFRDVMIDHFVIAKLIFAKSI